MELNILICGIGGQGIVLLGNFLRALLLKKYPTGIIAGTESRGVSQREGSVISTVRLNTNNDQETSFINQLGPEFSSHRADIVIALEPTEFLRNIHFIHDKTLMLVNNHVIQPKNTILNILQSNTALFNRLESSQEDIIKKILQILNSINMMPDPSIHNFNNNFHCLDFTSKTLNQFNSLSHLNFVMLGFLSGFISQYITSEDIEIFIGEYFNKSLEDSKNNKNISAFKYGKSLFLEIIRK